MAHGLKGRASAVGAVRLAEVSHRLCEAARAAELERGAPLQAELERSLASTRWSWLANADGGARRASAVT